MPQSGAAHLRIHSIVNCSKEREPLYAEDYQSESNGEASANVSEVNIQREDIAALGVAVALFCIKAKRSRRA